MQNITSQDMVVCGGFQFQGQHTEKLLQLLHSRTHKERLSQQRTIQIDTINNQSGLFTSWYQELAGFNFIVIHKEGKENSNADALSRLSHMPKAVPLSEDKYA